MQDGKRPELVYVGDPMCSWCWGFAPVIDHLGQHFTLPVRVMVGGLRPGPSAEEVDDRMAAFLAHHWHQVEERSGQPFNHAILQKRDWIYDTELPAVAVVTMRELNPPQALRFFTRLQRAFYVENVDITGLEAYEPLLAEFEVDQDRFLALLASDDMKWKAWEDFEEAQSLGVSGFPTLLVRADRYYTVARGWAPAEPLAEALSDWLTQRYGETATDMICELDGAC